MASHNTPLHNRSHNDEDDVHEQAYDLHDVDRDIVTSIVSVISFPDLDVNCKEGSSLYSPPPLTHHLDYKSKADIRRKELETLRQKQLAKPIAAQLQTAQAPNENLADFENKQRHSILKQRQNEKMALELLHQFRADHESIFKASLSPTQLAKSHQPKTAIIPDATASLYSFATSSTSPNGYPTRTYTSTDQVPEETLQPSTIILAPGQANGDNQASLLDLSTNTLMDHLQKRDQIILNAGCGHSSLPDSATIGNEPSQKSNISCKDTTVELRKQETQSTNNTLLPVTLPTTNTHGMELFATEQFTCLSATKMTISTAQTCSQTPNQQPSSYLDLVTQDKCSPDVACSTSSISIDHLQTLGSTPATPATWSVSNIIVGSASTQPQLHGILVNEKTTTTAPPTTNASLKSPTKIDISPTLISECLEPRDDTACLPNYTGTAGAAIVHQRQDQLGNGGIRRENNGPEHQPRGLWGFFAMTSYDVSRHRYARYL